MFEIVVDPPDERYELVVVQLRVHAFEAPENRKRHHVIKFRSITPGQCFGAADIGRDRREGFGQGAVEDQFAVFDRKLKGVRADQQRAPAEFEIEFQRIFAECMVRDGLRQQQGVETVERQGRFAVQRDIAHGQGNRNFDHLALVGDLMIDGLILGEIGRPVQRVEPEDSMIDARLDAGGVKVDPEQCGLFGRDVDGEAFRQFRQGFDEFAGCLIGIAHGDAVADGDVFSREPGKPECVVVTLKVGFERDPAGG